MIVSESLFSLVPVSGLSGGGWYVEFATATQFSANISVRITLLQLVVAAMLHFRLVSVYSLHVVVVLRYRFI